MKLLKWGLLAAFIPALSVADPPASPSDNPTPTPGENQMPGDNPTPTPGENPAPGDNTTQEQSTNPSSTPFGLTVKTLSADRRQAYGATGDAGVLVTKVDSDSPAYKAGVRTGDVITKIDETPLKDSSDLSSAWTKDKDQSKADIEVVRDHKTMTLHASLDQGAQNKMEENQQPQQPAAPDTSGKL